MFWAFALVVPPYFLFGFAAAQWAGAGPVLIPLLGIVNGLFYSAGAAVISRRQTWSTARRTGAFILIAWGIPIILGLTFVLVARVVIEKAAA